jgi:hypothetical protein
VPDLDRRLDGRHRCHLRRIPRSVLPSVTGNFFAGVTGIFLEV